MPRLGLPGGVRAPVNSSPHTSAFPIRGLQCLLGDQEAERVRSEGWGAVVPLPFDTDGGHQQEDTQAS